MAKWSRISSRNVTRVFLSYSRADGARVGEIADALSNAGDFEVFLDQNDILPSEEWRPRLEKLILQSDAVVFLVSRASIASDVCEWELERAEQMNKRIIPLMIQQVIPPFPHGLGKLNFLFATPDRDPIAVITELTTALNVDIGWLREHTRLGELAQRWESSKSSGAEPLRGKELAAAEEWLSLQPRGAPAPTSGQQTFIFDSRKLATRRQRGIVSGLLVTTSLVAVLALFAWSQRTAAIKGQQMAEAALREAVKAADTMTFDLAAELQISRVPQQLSRSILEKTLSLQESLGENFPDDPALLRSRISSQILVGKVLERKNDNDAAMRIYEEALANAERSAAPSQASIGDKSYLPLVWMYIGALQTDRAEYEQAVTSLQKSLDLYLAADEKSRTHITYRERVSEAHMFLAVPQMRLGRYQQADGNLTKALEVLRALKDDFDADFDTFVDLPHLLTLSAEAKLNLGQNDAARALYEEALAVAKANFVEAPENARVANAYMTAFVDLGDYRRREADAPAAEALYLEAYEVAREDMAIDARDVAAINSYAVLLDRLATVATERGDYKTAADRVQEALGYQRELIENEPENVKYLGDVIYTLGQLGHSNMQLEQHEAAIDALQESLVFAGRLSELGVEPHYDTILSTQETLVGALRRTGDRKGARALNAQIRAGADQALTDYPADTFINRYLAVAASNEGRLYIDAQDQAAAQPWLEEAVARFRTLHEGQPNPMAFGRDLHLVLNQLAENETALERYADAILNARAALDLVRKIAVNDPDNDLLKYDAFCSLELIATAQEKLDDPDSAYATRLDSVATIEGLAERNPDYVAWQRDFITAIDKMGMLLYRYKHYEQATAMFEEIVRKSDLLLATYPYDETFAFFATDGRQYLALTLARWSESQIANGEFGSAVQNAERALKSFPSNLWIKSYLANAYMVNGNTAQARDLYLAHRGQTFDSGQTWEYIVRTDFENMRRIDIDRLLMDEILTAFDAAQ